MTNQLLTCQLPVDYSLISSMLLMSSTSYVWDLSRAHWSRAMLDRSMEHDNDVNCDANQGAFWKNRATVAIFQKHKFAKLININWAFGTKLPTHYTAASTRKTVTLRTVTCARNFARFLHRLNSLVNFQGYCINKSHTFSLVYTLTYKLLSTFLLSHGVKHSYFS